MKRIIPLIITLFLVSCSGNKPAADEKIITVSIGPFRYFVESIAGNEFKVNVMVPAGSNPHVYEPFPEQIHNLRRSVAYVSNGFLGFEMAWLDRFYETNPTMKKLSLGEVIVPLDHGHHHHEGEHAEAADPHYWVSPVCAKEMASALRDFITGLNPGNKEEYMSGYDSLMIKIADVEDRAAEVLGKLRGRPFMIYHPNLGYLARDYGLVEVSVEYEGKEPPPSRMRELIDLARAEGIKRIFVQKEYDTKNARAIADEIGAEVVVIDPLSEDWYVATMTMIDELGRSFGDEVTQ
jgi:zinc transport system substrate-binding protein